MPRGVGFYVGRSGREVVEFGWLPAFSQYLAEILHPAPLSLSSALPRGGRAAGRHAKRAAERLSYPALLLVVWALKREVRAIRGCLGM